MEGHGHGDGYASVADRLAGMSNTTPSRLLHFGDAQRDEDARTPRTTVATQICLRLANEPLEELINLWMRRVHVLELLRVLHKGLDWTLTGPRI